MLDNEAPEDSGQPDDQTDVWDQAPVDADLGSPEPDNPEPAQPEPAQPEPEGTGPEPEAVPPPKKPRARRPGSSPAHRDRRGDRGGDCQA